MMVDGGAVDERQSNLIETCQNKSLESLHVLVVKRIQAIPRNTSGTDCEIREYYYCGPKNSMFLVTFWNLPPDILTAKQVSSCADAGQKSLRFPISSLVFLEKVSFSSLQLAAKDLPDFSV